MTEQNKRSASFREHVNDVVNRKEINIVSYASYWVVRPAEGQDLYCRLGNPELDEQMMWAHYRRDGYVHPFTPMAVGKLGEPEVTPDVPDNVVTAEVFMAAIKAGAEIL